MGKKNVNTMEKARLEMKKKFETQLKEQDELIRRLRDENEILKNEKRNHDHHADVLKEENNRLKCLVKCSSEELKTLLTMSRFSEVFSYLNKATYN